MSRRHYPVLDGLRGLAILAVLFKHAAYVFSAHGLATRWFLPVLQLGGYGVDLFFVLSGFLITGILLDTRTALNRGTSFYGRRILRIFPVYYLAIAIFLLLEPFSPSLKAALNLQGTADHLAYLFYFQNWIPLWHHGNFPDSIIGHFWSLAVEEQFYMVWPVLVWHLSARAISKLCVAALVFSLVLRFILVSHFGSGIWIYAFTLTRADGLYVGALLATVYALRGQISNRLIGGLFAGGVGLLALVAFLGPVRQLWLTGRDMSTIGITGLALAGGATLVFCLKFDKSVVGRFFQQSWLRSFGKYSYGMYVWHFPIYYAIEHLLKLRGVMFPLSTGIGFLYTALLIAAAYSAAWLSFNGYERWFLRLKSRFEPMFDENQKPETVPVEYVVT